MGSRPDKSQSNGKNCIDIAQRGLEQTTITSAVLFYLYLAVNNPLITRANFKMNCAFYGIYQNCSYRNSLANQE